jgi:hypothetical protein
MSTLWMLHVQGPDDIVGAPSREEADAVAAAFNAYWTAYLDKQRAQSVADGRNPDHWPSVSAVVCEWNGTAREHAHSVEKYWPDYAEYLKFGK